MADEDEVAQLRRAIENRTVIGIAMGILMDRLGLDRDGSFAVLCGLSSLSNRKLHDIAEEMSSSRERAEQWIAAVGSDPRDPGLRCR